MLNSLLNPSTEKKLKETLKQGPKRAATLDDKRNSGRPQDPNTTSPKAGATFVRKISVLDHRRSITRRSADFSLDEFSDT